MIVHQGRSDRPTITSPTSTVGTAANATGSASSNAMNITVLTENGVLSRTRAQDLKSVHKLNCWGSELEDVSIVRKMPHVEVLSLSVNNISTLADFAHCPNLKELYIRKNNIADINEVMYLKDLPKLRNLWLADNPCAESDNYRPTVLRALPNLHKLDNQPVQPGEVELAKQMGEPLVLPLGGVAPTEKNNGSASNNNQSTPTTKASPPSSASSNTPKPAAHPQRASAPSTGSTMPGSPEPVRRHSSQDRVNTHSTPQRDTVPYDDQPLPTTPATPSVHHNAVAPTQRSTSNHRSPQPIAPMLKREPSPGMMNSNSSSSAFHARVQTFIEHNNGSRYDSSDPMHEMLYGSANDVMTMANAPHHHQHHHQNNTHSRRSLPHSPTRQISLTKGGKNRNANILSAMLCLVKELDYPSLEVVETAIHCRMEELQELGEV